MANISGGFKALSRGLFQMAGQRARRDELAFQRQHDKDMQRIREQFATKRQLASEERADTRYTRRLEENRGYQEDIFAERQTAAEGKASTALGQRNEREDFKEFRKQMTALSSSYEEKYSSNGAQYASQVDNVLRTFADSASPAMKREMGRIAVNTLGAGREEIDNFDALVSDIFKRYSGQAPETSAGPGVLDVPTKDTPGFLDQMSSIFPSETPQLIKDVGSTAQRIGQKTFGEAGRDIGSGVADIFGELGQGVKDFANPPGPSRQLTPTEIQSRNRARDPVDWDRAYGPR